MSEYGTELATILNERENTYVRTAATYAADIGEGESLWIGMNDIDDEGNWDYWNDGTYSGEFKNWYASDPDNAGTGQNCAAMYGVDTNEWIDSECESNYYFVCNCHLYIAVDIKMNWTQANDYCQTQYGTNLAIIHDKVENECGKQMGDTLQVTYNSTKNAWIGVYWNSNDSQWTLPSGTPVSSRYSGEFNLNWKYGELNDYDSIEEDYIEKCVGIQIDGWYNEDCGSKRMFLCDNPKNPTSMPTFIPTSNPTIIPSTYPTFDPSFQPTETPISLSNAKLLSRWNDTGTYVVFGGLCLGLLICGYALYIQTKTKKVADNMNFIAIFRFISQSLDLWTDLSFCIILYIQQQMQLLYSSLVFLIIPYLMSCIVSIYWIIVWNNWKHDHPHRLKNYLKSYEIFIILLSVFGGFYATVDLLRSKLFYLRLFYLPLKRDEYEKLQYLRFINFVILENIPQFMIQLWYLFFTSSSNGSGGDKFLPIVFVALFMTIVGLLFGMLKVLKKLMEENCVYSCLSRNEKFSKKHNSWLMKLRDDYDIKTKINCQFVIECSKPRFRQAHGFCHKKMGNSLKMVLDTCKDKKYWHGRNNVFYTIECYHIESQYHLNRLTVFFELNLFTKFHDKKNKHHQLPRVGSVSSVVSIDSIKSHSDTASIASGNLNGANMNLGDSFAVHNDSNNNSNNCSVRNLYDKSIMSDSDINEVNQVNNDDMLSVSIAKHESVVLKLKENIIDMFDLLNGSQNQLQNGNISNNTIMADITKDWISAMEKMFRMPNDANIIILFDTESDIQMNTIYTRQEASNKKDSAVDVVSEMVAIGQDIDREDTQGMQGIEHINVPRSPPNMTTSKASEIAGEINQTEWLNALAATNSNFAIGQLDIAQSDHEKNENIAEGEKVDIDNIGNNVIIGGTGNVDDNMYEEHDVTSLPAHITPGQSTVTVLVYEGSQNENINNNDDSDIDTSSSWMEHAVKNGLI